jgi:hypothetical protein
MVYTRTVRYVQHVRQAVGCVCWGWCVQTAPEVLVRAWR